MPTDVTSMWGRYGQALRDAEQVWTEDDPPPVVTAVALVTGLDPAALHDYIEGMLGWESHDTGYEYTTWFAAWSMKGYPDWQPPKESADGHQPVGGT
jgi:hypothetical protein